MIVNEARQLIINELRSVYPEGEAIAISRLVLEKLTVMPKGGNIFNDELVLNNIQVDTLYHYIKRLQKNEPVQYVLGQAWFYDFLFLVTNKVLIPRVETEELVHWIISEWKDYSLPFSILDIGTGSGCIPITLKKKLPQAAVHACDISAEALDVASNNAKNLNAELHIIQTDFLNQENYKQFPTFDVIVSNPPYVPEKDKATMQPNVLNYEPAVALFVPDNDSLIFYKAIAQFGKSHLLAGGAIYLEIHENLGSNMCDLFNKMGYKTIIKKDMQGKDRMVKAFKQ
jgi:release factor glutamine methyltransferase